MGKLIQIEVSNFKSYKGHQTIGPFYDFTSIIGPNGAGKSNLMDAISFVLGIKSSQLRSSQLRDLIYRGRILMESNGMNGRDEGDEDDEEEGPTQTQTQRTNGDDERGPRRAWVMAVYKEDNGKEIRYKRTITPGGGSEYRIDGKQVSAADYQHALEKHNILIKARNFLVFQGDVEAIASQSPKDLTRLIEQISGSLELKEDYEKLKEESERAAETSTFNYHKQRGIKAEIKQYEEQKSEAERYERTTEERDQAIVTHTLWKLFQLDSAIESHRDSLGASFRQAERLRKDLADAEAKHDQGKKELASLHRDLLKGERALKKKEHAIEEQKPSLVSIDEKLSHTERSLHNLRAKREAVEKDQKNYEKDVKSRERDLETVRKAANKFEEDQKKLAQQKGVALSDADQAEYRKLKEETIKQGASEKAKLENVKRQLRTEREVRDDLRSKEEQLDMQKSSVSEETRLLTEKHDNLTSKVNTLTQDVTSKRKEVETVKSERTRREIKKTELNEKLQACLSKIQQMNYDLRETERERQQRETLATLKRVFPLVRGRVVDLCKPTQNRYTTAVETILGRHINSVVVDTEKCANECINYLLSARLPPRTFIPLDTIMTKPVNANLRSIHRNAKLGIDVVNYERAYERAMAYVFGNAVVCDDYSVAREITVQRGHEVKCVCLDGTVINKNGTITGGQGKKTRVGKNWEESEFEALLKVRDAHIAQLEGLGQDPLGREDDLKAALDSLESSLKDAQEQLSAVQRTRNGKQEESKHCDKELGTLKPKVKKVDAEITKLQKEETNAADAWHRIEDKIFDAFCKRIKVNNIRIYEEQQGGLAKENAAQRNAFSRQISNLQSQLTFEKERLQETNDRLKKLTAGINRDKAQLKELQSEKQQIEDDIKQTTDELAEFKTGHQKAKVKYEEFQGKVNKLRRAVDAVRTNIDNHVKEMGVHETEVERAATERYALLRKCKLEEIDVPLAAGSIDSVPINADFLIRGDDPDSMDVDDDGMLRTEIPDWGIEIDYDSLSDELRRDDSDELDRELLKEIKELSDQLEHMAPNMKAVDRLHVVTDRLRETNEEFEEARKTAKAVKDRFLAVKQERYDKFMEAFEHIKNQIDRIYKELTRSENFKQGGSAYLTLEDSEEPYLDGVKYNAMPPMKRFRDMDQLSGGEKTIAALALLFAIHSYHPSPFFVLDEVDAALDNANVAKVAKYIRNNARPGFQFVVISLKSSLFVQSEALVGIYRDQEENSSRCLTLDLTEYPSQIPVNGH